MPSKLCVDEVSLLLLVELSRQGTHEFLKVPLMRPDAKAWL